jgi:hypothetical protein
MARAVADNAFSSHGTRRCFDMERRPGLDEARRDATLPQGGASLRRLGFQLKQCLTI